jgi:murein DD-endopeptidase MepM/ murein hydrolase activator NlpD
MKNQIKSSTVRKKAQLIKPATRKNSVKQPNWNMQDFWERHVTPLYRNKLQPLMTNKKMLIAGISAVACFSLGVFSLTELLPNVNEQKLISETIEKTIQAQADTQYIPADAETLNMHNLSAMMQVEKPLEITIGTYALMINGVAVGNFESQGSCEDILSSVVGAYSDQPDAKLDTAEFKEQVTITKVDRFVGSFSRYDDAEVISKYIIKGTMQEKKHLVQSGESLWSIAQTNQVKMDDLIRANPSINPDKLKINQEVSLVVPKPLITVITKETKEYSVDIPFEVAYEDNSNIYKGESSVKKAGTKGEKFVQAEIVKENGVETERIIVKEEVLSQPSTKIVYKGTKEPPPRIGTGSFIRPSRGNVTSPFGKRWGRMHEGIDYGMPVGTDVKASDGGKVIYAGRKDAYGLCVIIDHGGNMTTLYAHNSKLLVSKGDKVFQGQLIAKSGNTGRSTGPHLHFEIRINGTPVNPAKYVK